MIGSDEHPILFNTAMVRAILDGRKTMTIRPIRPQPVGPILSEISFKRRGDQLLEQISFGPANKNTDGTLKRWTNPFGNTGHLLWVRESFDELEGGHILYREDMPEWALSGYLWKPSIHMPRRLARIFLEVVDTRFQPIHDITTAQISAEGVDGDFPAYWDSIYGAGEFAWHHNPMVWVCRFKRG